MKVAILCGGISSEHEVSCTSAGGVLSAIDRKKFEPIAIGITKKGSWVLLPEGFNFSIQNGVLPEIPEELPKIHAEVSGLFIDGKPLGIDLIFPVLHGLNGEDGTIQGYLEVAKIPYVGSGVLASAVAMDKPTAKTLFSAHGMKVAAGITVTRSQWSNQKSEVSQDIANLGYPVFVKPARGGSSRGTNKVNSNPELTLAIENALEFDNRALVESAVVGSEIECAVLEINGIPTASIVGQIHIDSRFDFYDFEAKYLDSATSIELPAPISEKSSAEIRNLALKAFEALGCSGLARVDFFLTENGEVIINELNTMPGFTTTSVFPKMWEASGISYTEVITQLIATGLARSASYM